MNNPRQSDSKLLIDKETATIRDYNQVGYSQFWTGFSKSLFDKKEQRIVQKLVLPASGWFVDLGCGYGRFLPAYVNSNRKIVLVDYALNLLEEAANKYSQENIYFIAADVYHLPFRDNIFDCGLSVRLFHHINAPRSFLREISRVFREGAGIVLSYSNKRNLLRILKHGSKALQHDHEQYGEMLFGTHPVYFDKLCKNEKLVVNTTRGTGFLDQIFRDRASLNQLFDRMSFLAQPLLVIEDIMDFAFGRLHLLPNHFALLNKRSEKKSSSVDSGSCRELIDIMACPDCRSSHLTKQEKTYTCSGCGKIYPIYGKIIDFRLEKKQ